MPISQRQFVFFGERDVSKRKEPTSKEKHEKIESVFRRYVGNESALVKLKTAAFTALSRPNHQMSDLSFGFFGPPSCGKTTLARLYAEVVDLPYVELSAQSLEDLNYLLDKVSEACQRKRLRLEKQMDGNYYLPPVVIFIDEAHNLSKSVMQGLLKATEHEDRMMQCEDGTIVNTKCVTWMIATTDEGLLFDAFRTRFSPIHLKYLKKSDISKIVREKHPDLSSDACDRIAFYNSRIPRKALEFARYVEMYLRMREDLTDCEAVDEVATQEGIDSSGMHEVHLKVLLALKDGPVAKSRIGHITGRKTEENERYIMPWLLADVEDQPALVKVTTRGYILTKDGEEVIRQRLSA